MMYIYIIETTKKYTTMKNLINWGELSRILSGNRSVVTKNRMPKKHEKKVDALKKAIDKWRESLND